MIPGVYENVLRHSIKYLKNSWEEGKFEKLLENSYIQEIWLRLGERIAAWGCVGSRIVA